MKLKSQIVIKLKNSKFDDIKNLKLWLNSETQIVM